MTPQAEAVYRNLSDRSGVLDGIEDTDILEELCESVAADVLAAEATDRAVAATAAMATMNEEQV